MSDFFPRWSLLWFASILFPRYFGEAPFCDCCKIKRLQRWILRSVRQTPSAWKRVYASNATMYEHETYKVSVRIEKWKVIIGRYEEKYVTGPRWNLRFRMALNKMAGARIAKQVFNW